MIAQDPLQHTYMWHKIYSLSRTKVLGKLACLVTSKNLGIGSAERHWKIIKAAKNGQRTSLCPEKTKMQALIYGTAMQKKQRYRQDKLRAAGKLWCDDDFESMKLDLLCNDTVESAAALPKKTARIFRAWEEEWEKVKIGPGGDDVHEARLVSKYGGLRWLDADNGYRVCETHPNEMFFEKKRGNNKYIIFATYQGFDLEKSLKQQTEKFDGWPKTQKDFYEEVVSFYKDSYEVKCYTKGGECDSESEEE